MKFILDCSVTMPWLLRNDSTGYAENILKYLGDSRNLALVPRLWYLEVGNTLLVAESRKKITEAESERFIQWLQNLPIEEDDSHTLQFFDRTMSMAREHKLSFYDAVYLELAMRESLPIATLDKQLKEASLSVGIELVT